MKTTSHTYKRSSTIILIQISCLLLCIFTTTHSYGQGPGCPNVNAGPDTTLPCSPACVDLTATLLETGTTTDYTVGSIPYAPPFPFTGGTSIFIGQDDVWSSVINLPFNFCFYGGTYNQLVVGANGLLTFDVGWAGSMCEWSFASPIPTPGPPPNGIYNNSINGAFHDIDPSVINTGAACDINYAVLGTAPCRTFVVNFYQIPHYDPLWGPCNQLETTQQIVLYETTNAIEVYINSKPTCNTWNSGNAVIGLQNAGGTQGISPPGRNTGPWSANNEAWQFVPSGPQNYVVEWFDGNTTVGTGNPINVCPTVQTDYVVQVTYTNCDGSVIVETDTVEVTPTVCGCSTGLPTTTPISCEGMCDGTASVAVATGVAPYTYSWFPSGGTGPTATGLCADTVYQLTVIDSNSDTCHAAVSLTGPDALNVSIGYSTDPTCMGLADGSAAALANGGTGAYTYSWSPSGSTNPVATGLEGGITHIVTVWDQNGCMQTDSVFLINPPSVKASISSYINPLCDTSLGQATVTISNGVLPYTYTWLPNGGTSPTGTGLAGGVTYAVIVLDANGCMDTDSILLSTPAPLTISTLSVNDPMCAESIDGNIDIAVTGGTGTYTYAWAPPVSTGASASSLAGNTNYSIVVTDSAGCNENILIPLSSPQPLVAAIAGDAILCLGDTSHLSLSAAGGTQSYSYTWIPSGSQNPALAVAPIQDTTCSAIVLDSHGCTDTASFGITVHPLPVVDFGVDTISGCDPLTVEFYSFSDSTAACLWDIGEGIMSSENIFTHTYNTPGAYDVELNITDINGCTGSHLKPGYIQVYETPTANFEADQWITSVNMPTIEFEDHSISADTWQWNFGGLGNSTAQNPSFEFPTTDTGTYPVNLMVYTYNGCSDSITKEVQIKGDFMLFVPNSFTPNGDGINDLFIPEGTGFKKKDLSLSIYNRWGAEIYHTDNGEPWNGTRTNGDIATQQEVYVWIIQVADEMRKYHYQTGHVTVLF